ncbi:12408_t:CDS:2, partial [Racocetra persica]
HKNKNTEIMDMDVRLRFVKEDKVRKRFEIVRNESPDMRSCEKRVSSSISGPVILQPRDQTEGQANENDEVLEDENHWG